MSKRRSSRITDLEAEYRALAPTLPLFCEELERQLSRLIREGDITLGFPLQHRVKSWDSIAEKLTRARLPITQLGELQDLVGFRIILLFRRDVDKVCDLISSCLTVVRRYDTAERLSDDQFGYSSVHFAIRLPESWLALPTLSSYRDLTAEVQVRTVAQHIWAEVSHRLQYKREANVPAALKRSIYRASALLETVDLEFERLLSDRTVYRDELPLQQAEKRLNVDLLERVLDSALPAENKKPGDEDYAEAVEDLMRFGVETRDSLTELIETQLEAALAEDRRIVDGLRTDQKDIKRRYIPEAERLARGVFYTHVGLIREMLDAKFGARWRQYIQGGRKPTGQ
jgi:putative GTP pyrophosphokinase